MIHRQPVLRSPMRIILASTRERFGERLCHIAASGANVFPRSVENTLTRNHRFTNSEGGEAFFSKPCLDLTKQLNYLNSATITVALVSPLDE